MVGIFPGMLLTSRLEDIHTFDFMNYTYIYIYKYINIYIYLYKYINIYIYICDFHICMGSNSVD